MPCQAQCPRVSKSRPQKIAAPTSKFIWREKSYDYWTVFLILVLLIIMAVFYRKGPQDEQPRIAQRHDAILQALANSALYRDYAAALCDCVINNYQSCALVRPGNFINHLAPMGMGVFEDRFGHIIFRYKFTRSVENARIGEITYSTLPGEKMVATLNQSFQNYCLAHGVAPLSIAGGINDNNGIVYFYICPFASLQEAKQYLGWR